jgi:THO complex subunit 3
LILAVTRL